MEVPPTVFLEGVMGNSGTSPHGSGGNQPPQQQQQQQPLIPLPLQVSITPSKKEHDLFSASCRVASCSKCSVPGLSWAGRVIDPSKHVPVLLHAPLRRSLSCHRFGFSANGRLLGFLGDVAGFNVRLFSIAFAN